MRRLNRGSRPATGTIAAWAALAILIQLVACAAKQASEEPATAAQKETTAGGDATGVPGLAAPGTQQYQQLPNYSVSSAAADLDSAEKELELALADKDAAGQPLATGTDRCTLVCKALASMRRSADQICGIDASRCEGARARVTKAEQRAKDACPVCATPT
jgi:hypothetical protein